ncbi:MAG: thioredoxin family protein [Desulfobacterales bacterium]|jgi:small redox-active disulfide protein 2
MNIKILGPGCKKCDQTAARVAAVVEACGADAEVEKVTDMMTIAGFGVMATPAVVVDGEVKCAGKIPERDEIAAWLGENN